MEKKIKILVAKPGLDGHDRGAKVVASALRDAGINVVYSGVHQTPDQIVSTALKENVDVVGLSILSGAHIRLTEAIVKLLRERGSKQQVIVGGVFPDEDVDKLKSLGAAAVFPAGSRLDDIIEYLNTTDKL